MLTKYATKTNVYLEDKWKWQSLYKIALCGLVLSFRYVIFINSLSSFHNFFVPKLNVIMLLLGVLNHLKWLLLILGCMCVSVSTVCVHIYHILLTRYPFQNKQLSSWTIIFVRSSIVQQNQVNAHKRPIENGCCDRTFVSYRGQNWQ